MKHALLLKSLALAGLALGLLVPLAMIEGQIAARSQNHKAVQDNVSASAAGRQQLVGPLLVVTYTQEVAREATDEATGKTRRWVAQESRRKILVPRELAMTGEAQVEERHRGLYKARLYHADLKLRGTFSVPAGYGIEGWGTTAREPKVSLVLGLTDLRGIRNRPALRWDGAPRDLVPGGLVRPGIHADLGPLQPGEHAFELPLALTGSQALSVAPVGEETRLELGSRWPSPSFGGRFLPLRRSVGEQGFQASWQVFHLARNLDRILEAREGAPTEEAFEVAFLEPVNVYLQSERAVKYGILFVVLTFGACFLLELLRGLRIHPVQYLLVGLALAMFFLLLISLTEHVPFLWAYLAAGGACLALLGVYLVHVLRDRRRALGFTGMLALLYAVLYGLLSSEDNALLMGALVLFGALSAVMLLTRRLDWYGLSRTGDPAP